MRAESARTGVPNEGSGGGEPAHRPVSRAHVDLREKEHEWCRTHPDELRALRGEWVILEGDRIVGHGTDPAALIYEAKRQAIKIPYIFYVREVDGSLQTLGL
jgi:hypothetical protein